MFYLPLTASPLGWVVLGVSGYVLYKTGKKKGQDQAAAAQITEPPETEAKKTKAKGGKS